MKNIDSVNSTPKARGPNISVQSGLPNKPVFYNLKETQKKYRGKWVIVLIFLIISAIPLSLALKANSIKNSIFVGEKIGFFGTVKSFLFNAENNGSLEGETENQINVLLLGIGGEGHDGPYLTDTMIVAQIRLNPPGISLVSVPRDFWIEMPDTKFYGKINSVFAENFAKTKKYELAGNAALRAVEKVSALNIPYFALIDFKGFEQAIDEIGGLDIQIENTFTDSSFPDGKLGYLPPVTFISGTEHMDGKRALIFARSRHGNNNEGSDFARSQRQQKVISAFKNKVLNMNIFKDAGTLNKLLTTFSKHFATNLSAAQTFKLYSELKEKNIQSISSVSLDEASGLVCPKVREDSGAFTLTLCPNISEQNIHAFFQDSFQRGLMAKEKTTVWLVGNGQPDKTKAAINFLKTSGFTAYELPPLDKPISQNAVFQVNLKPASFEYISKKLPAKEITLPPPGVKTDKEKVDIIVILGAE